MIAFVLALFAFPAYSKIVFNTDLATCPGVDECLGDSDRAVITSKWDDLKGDVQYCAIKCIISGTSCMETCVEGLGFSECCAECWVGLASCTKSSCIWDCLIPSSSSCSNCAYKNCFPDLETCSGLSSGDLPPP